MDDLDHSIYISEYDWSVFYEESEQCVLLLPSLAVPDDSCVSDTEESGNLSSDICTQFDLIPDEKNICITEYQSSGSLMKQTTEAIPEKLIGNKTITVITLSALSLAEEQEQEGNLQTVVHLESTKEPLTNQMGVSGFEMHAERPVREDLGRLGLREEKDRWFVTVNDNLAPKQNGATYIKKKHGLKKTPCESCELYQPNDISPEETGEQMKTNRENDSRGKRRRPSGHQSVIHPSIDCNQVQIARESTLSEEDISETTRKRSISEPVCRRQQLEHAESDELDDSAEFFSIHSFDSESYLSAEESQSEEENLPPHCSPSTTDMRLLFSLTGDADEHEVQMQSCEGALLINVDAFDSSCAAQSPTFPTGSESAIEYPSDNSMWKDNMHSRASDTSENQNHNISLTASGCSGNQQCIPDVTITSCSGADSLETYAGATGPTHPVYAISAFWNEMEKLTINDILHLRAGREPSSKRSSAAVPSSPSDSGVYSLTDMALIETSDTADSGHFTQRDESKPDCSSCEFSTSDFEEEYWQFTSDSKEPSPDTNKNQQRVSYNLTLEEESANSEGKETPVPSEESWEEFEPKQARLMMKSKSVQNVQALLTERMSSSASMVDDLSGLMMRWDPPVAERVLLEMSNFLQTKNCASLSIDTDLLFAHDGIPFPRPFDPFFTEINANPQCVKVYDPQDISMSPAFDCTVGEEMATSFLHRIHTETPVPIFSCSYPTVRDLTLAKLDCIFLHSDCKGANEVSPMRVVSHSFIHADQHRHLNWKYLMLPQRIRFNYNGSTCWGNSGVWTFATEKMPVKIEDLAVPVVNEGRNRPTSFQMFGELEEQQRMLETFQATKTQGIFSSLKQSDMCLVCIAFASWVLRSSDPEAADAWKAALLANVSALSAIQYLRRYVKKKNP